MRIQVQQRGSVGPGCEIVSRAGDVTPTTPWYRPSCRRSAGRVLGDWLSRDPIGERGGRDLYGFVYNNPIGLIDTLGEAVFTPDFVGPLIPPDFYGTPIPDPKNPGNDRADRERYAREVMNQFADLQRRNPDKCCKLDACSLAAQWMAESNWGRSGLAKDAKNLGGIKGSGPAGSYNAKTKEFENGTAVQITDNFRVYNSSPEFYADYANLICKANRYNGARGKKGREYYEALKQSGYSTDPTYADKMMQLYRQLGCK